MTRLIPIIAVAFSLFVPYSSFAQGWIGYVNQQDFFTVNFPGEPEVRDITFESEYSISLPGRVYSHENGSTRYSITVIDYTDIEAKHEERAEKCRAVMRATWRGPCWHMYRNPARSNIKPFD